MPAMFSRQVQPVPYPVHAARQTMNAGDRFHCLPGGIPSIEQILQGQPMTGQTAGGDGADQLLAALKRDNDNLERMLQRLTALAGEG